MPSTLIPFCGIETCTRLPRAWVTTNTIQPISKQNRNTRGIQTPTLNTSDRAVAPSFSSLLRPTTNTSRASFCPAFSASSRQSRRARDKIWKTPHQEKSQNLEDHAELQPTFPPPIPIPVLLNFSTFKEKHAGLVSRLTTASIPDGPKALSLRSSSVSWACDWMTASPRAVWEGERETRQLTGLVCKLYLLYLAVLVSRLLTLYVASLLLCASWQVCYTILKN